MMKTTTKYIAIRETEGAYGRTYRRYQECSSKKAGIAWFKGGDLGPCRTVSIYAVEFDEGEDLSTLQPCMKKRIPEVGTLVFKKYNDKIIFEELEQEAETEAKAEPAMNEWRVSTNYCGGERSYQVYRRIDANATDHSGNRENKGGVFGAKAEAQAYADKLNAGEDLEAPETKPEPKHEEEAIEEKSGSARYYAVLKVAENRKQTCFHFKRRVFYDDQKAIDFARSRLRGGCKEAAVYMFDPATIAEKPETFETDKSQHDAKNIMALLWNFEIFYIDRHTERDMRDEVRARLLNMEGSSIHPYSPDPSDELHRHAEHFQADGVKKGNPKREVLTMVCDADIRHTRDVYYNANILTLEAAERWYKEATA